MRCVRDSTRWLQNTAMPIVQSTARLPRSRVSRLWTHISTSSWTGCKTENQIANEGRQYPRTLGILPFLRKIVQIGRNTSPNLSDRRMSFFGESYPVNEKEPLLFCYHAREMETSEFLRQYRCSLYFRKDRRHWLRLTLSMTVSAESEYWNMIESVNSINRQWKTSHNLPSRIESRLESFLRAEQTFSRIQQDSHISMYLGSGYCVAEQGQGPADLKLRLCKPQSFDVQEYLLKISEIVNHWLIPRYFEGQLIHRSFSLERRGSFFLAYVHSHSVYECRFSSDRSQIDNQWHMLKLLHSIRGDRCATGVNPLLGVVMDKEREIVTGFLCELPTNGVLFDVMRADDAAGRPCSWKRRLKWCRQIIEAVAEAHSQNFVLGNSHTIPNVQIGIDANDNAALFRRFATALPHNNFQPWTLPPECRSLGSSGNQHPSHSRD